METEEQRTTRLARLSANQSERLLVKTEEQRTTRLARLSANQSERLELSFLHLRHFDIVELSLASHLHTELTPSLFDEKTQQVLGTMN